MTELMPLATFEHDDPDWVSKAVACMRRLGFAVVTGVLSDEFLARIRPAMYEAERRIISEIGNERIQRTGDGGVVRVMLNYDHIFAELLSNPFLLAFIDATVGPTAIMQLQNGLILRPQSEGRTNLFGSKFHRDFPRLLNGYLASVNVMVTIDDYHQANGATLVLPGSHQNDIAFDVVPPETITPIECPKGSFILFDSTLVHCAGSNITDSDRLAINHMFTRSWIKPQIDFVRAMGDTAILSLPERTQQLLGWYTRVVTSLDEYYQPEELRLYRRFQG